MRFDDIVSVEGIAWWVTESVGQHPKRMFRPKRYPLSIEEVTRQTQSRMDRAEAMANRYRSGQTLQEIANDFKISRQRVEQILKPLGIEASQGGITVRGLLKAREVIEKRKQVIVQREAKVRARWGISLDDWQVFRKMKHPTPLEAYRSQRSAARRRKIEWQFTFPEWWKIWSDSGHYQNRGPGQGYCMARYGDSGPYSPNNVYICTIGQNFSDSYITKPHRNLSGLRGRLPMSHCMRGHQFTPENTYILPRHGTRVCKACHVIRSRKWREKRRKNGA